MTSRTPGHADIPSVHHLSQTIECPECGGERVVTGRYLSDAYPVDLTCPICNGTGRVKPHIQENE